MPAQAAVGDGGDRRGATHVPHPRIFAEPKKRATIGRPYKIEVRSVRKIRVKSVRKIRVESAHKVDM